MSLVRETDWANLHAGESAPGYSRIELPAAYLQVMLVLPTIAVTFPFASAVG